jgi:putative acetyltransferase
MALDILDITASPDHMPVVRDLFREYAAELGINLNFQGFEDELADLPGCYEAPFGCILLAYDGEALAGCVALRPLEDDTAEIKRMYVRPAHRRKGMAAALATSVLQVAFGGGYRRVRLDTLRSMTPARALYESFGFREIAPYYHNPIPDVIFYELDFYAEAREVVARNVAELGTGPWGVVFYNNDETSMEFVHMVLNQTAGLSPQVAEAVTHMTHLHGSAIARRFEEREEAVKLQGKIESFVIRSGEILRTCVMRIPPPASGVA